MADNRVEELPPECAGLTSLRTLSMCVLGVINSS